MDSTGEITTELVQKILREAEKDNSIVVLPNLVVTELNEDLHAGSCLSRVTVTYTRHKDTSEKHMSLIVKTSSKNTSIGSNLDQSTVFLREIQMYSDILPRMSVLLAHALPDTHTELSARIYYTRKSPSCLIAVEDLASKGFKAPKRKNGLDLEHCLLALRTLARFHAASVMIRHENENLFAVFDKVFQQEDSVKKTFKYVSGKAIPLVSQAAESWPEFGPSWVDRLRHRYETLHEELDTLLKRDDSGFNVLNHADFGLHNVMFRHSESSGDLEAIMLVDFQCCSYNSPVFDLHQFIFTSASDEVRPNHINKLLIEYHYELSATLEKLGAPHDSRITLTQLLNDFNSKLLYGFFYTTTFMPILKVDKVSDTDTTPESGRNEDIENAKRYVFLTESASTSIRKILPFFSQNHLP